MQLKADDSKAPLPALTGARFFAAFAVVVHHYGQGSIRFFAPLLVCAKAGPAAVSFFYVLSGAVMTWGCTGPDGTPSRPTRKFWAQRAARLLPAYVAALALSFLPFVGEELKHHPGAPGAVRIALGLLASSTLLQAFIIPLAWGLNTPAWSISCEAFFYANWPRLVTALRSERASFPWGRAVAAWLLGLVVPLLAIVALRAGIVPAGPYATLQEDVSGGELLVRAVSYFPPFRLPEFVLGIVVGHALRRTPSGPRSLWKDTAREGALLAALGGAAWAFGSGLGEELTGVAVTRRICIESGATSLLFALLVWQLARGDGLGKRLLSRPWLLLLGEASYAMYVLQEPVVVWTTATLKRLQPAAMAHWDAIFWLYAAALVLGSVVIHKKWETPLRKLMLRRFTSAESVAAR